MTETERTSLTTKDLLIRVLNTVEGLEGKVDSFRESQVRIETIVTEGRFNERITALEKFRDRFEGAMSPVKWAIGGSGIAIVWQVLELVGVIN